MAMSKIKTTSFPAWIKHILIIFLIGGLIVLIYLVLNPFLVPIAWALVLAHITWPIYLRLNIALGNRPTLCALIMVTSTATLILLPLLWFTLLIQDNIAHSYHLLVAYLANGKNLLPDSMLTIPWLGEELKKWINAHLVDPAALKQQLSLWAKQGSSGIVEFLGSVGRNGAKAAFTAIILFVVYRDGERLLRGTKIILCDLLGERTHRYFQAAGEATRAVMFGVILIAIAQGTLAGIGFLLFGVPNVIMLASLTAIASLIPILGTFLIWGPASLWLLINGHPWEAAGLLVWGSLLIGTADNLIRPLVISTTMRVSFLLVMFGIFGGIFTFGLIGLFIGPIILSIGLTAWNEWSHDIQSSEQ